MRAQVVIPAPAQLLTHNAERRMHHMQRASVVRLWRKSAMVWAQVTRMQKFQSAEVWFLIEQAKGRLADPVSHSPCGKAIIDGLVDAKILKDDTGEYVTKVTYLPVIRGEKDQITVGLIGEPRDENEPLPSATDQLSNLRSRRAEAIRREQRNCSHPMAPTGICLGCGAPC